MTKYLLLAAVLVAAYALWRKGQRPPPPPAAPRRGAPQAMVGCARCGLLLPRDEALAQGGRHYCCAAHRDQGPA